MKRKDDLVRLAGSFRAEMDVCQDGKVSTALLGRLVLIMEALNQKHINAKGYPGPIRKAFDKPDTGPEGQLPELPEELTG